VTGRELVGKLQPVRFDKLRLPRPVRLGQPALPVWLARPGWLARPARLARPPEQAPAAGGRLVRPRAAAAAAGWMLCGLLLFGCYLHMSRTIPVNSDGASNALQAWAMLHGNPLLRGWELSDVTFYTTELPQYMLVELARGLTPDVVHVAAATTYTLVILLTARLAKGSARGLDGLLRAGLAAGIMLAPQRSEVAVLMLSPDHVGSTVPVLLMWLLIDRAGRRWYVPVAAFTLLAWALVADQIVLITGVLPLVAVALARAYQVIMRQRAGVGPAVFDLALAAAAIAAAEAGWRALALIRSSGGFLVWPVGNRLVAQDAFPHNLLQTYHGILLLFGADFMGQLAGYVVAIALIHLIGIGLAVWAVCAALRRFAGAELVVQLMAAAAVISLAAYVLGPNAGQALSSREFAAVLPFSAALAGRILAGRLRQARLVPALALVLGVYLAGAGRVLALPPVPAQNQAVANWLAAHHLDYGLAGYWTANSVTLDSGGAVQLRSLKSDGRTVWPDWWETAPGWYSPAAHLANFVVLPAGAPAAGPGPALGPGPEAPTVPAVLRSFGQPAQVYFLADYTILVWNKNLLADLQWAPGRGP
jgi:hypothetical protein